MFLRGRIAKQYEFAMKKKDMDKMITTNEFEADTLVIDAALWEIN